MLSLQNRKTAPFIFLTVSMVFAAVVMIAIVSIGFAIALAVAQLAISILFPWWMVCLQRHKK